MKDQLSMWTLWNLPEKISRKRISSPGSEAGPSPFASPGGQTTGLCGRALAPASRSVSQEKAPGQMIPVTSGPTSIGSLAPADPLSSWESKLRQRLASLGSTECLLTWKESVTPQGRQLSRLVPSMRPIVATDYGLWPTPTLPNGGRSIAHADEWRGNTPYCNGKKIQVDLSQVVKGMWPTPTTTDAKRGVGTIRPHDTGIPLPQRVAQTVAMWPTPMAHEARLGYQRRVGDTKGSQKSLTTEATDHLGLGENITGLRGQTERPGALNPAFVCWLMGFPAEWEDCAPTAMPSRRRWPQKS
jgi:hypothetical protein